VQFFKEEVEEGAAVYNVYLKKVNYHTSLNDVSLHACRLTFCPDTKFTQI